ncbi:MAG: HEAT repeat domain-containing protein [Candidatus Binatia bacterium]
MLADEESQALENFLASLNQSDKAQIRTTVDALIALMPIYPGLAARLEHLLPQTNEEKRWPIAYALAHLPRLSSLALEALLGALDNRDSDIRWAVNLRLVELGKRHNQVAAALTGLVHSGTSTQRRMAVYCLRDLDWNDRSILATLLEALHDPEPLVRVAAVTSLKGAEIGREATLSLIGILFHDCDSRVKCAAAITLAYLGEPAEAIRAALEEAGRGVNSHVQKACRTALELLKKKEPVPPTR